MITLSWATSFGCIRMNSTIMRQEQMKEEEGKRKSLGAGFFVFVFPFSFTLYWSGSSTVFWKRTNALSCVFLDTIGSCFRTVAALNSYWFTYSSYFAQKGGGWYAVILDSSFHPFLTQCRGCRLNRMYGRIWTYTARMDHMTIHMIKINSLLFRHTDICWTLCTQSMATNRPQTLKRS